MRERGREGEMKGRSEEGRSANIFKTRGGKRQGREEGRQKDSVRDGSAVC